MFTDIEGSTRLLHALGDRYGDVLRDHHELILSSVERHGGRLVDTQGDGCFVVFSSAEYAVAAATSAQQALAEHPWPSDVEVKVRMGLHTGTPVPMEERYVGIDVHRAARIAAVAHGGQVIASSSTMQLTAASGVSWVGLGRYRLKDLTHPERIHQLRAPGLRSEFPPLRAPRWGSGLPEPSTRFVGRTGDVDAVSALLLDPGLRLVTLVGPGGIGKTRLATHIGHLCVDRFEDGVAFVPLATLTEADEVVPAIAAAVGAPETAAEETAVTLIEHLRAVQFLLILDNLEHLPADTPLLIADLLVRCGGLRVLATSRAPLNISGERLYEVAPLGLSDDEVDIGDASRSDAVALFIDRARSIAPTFRLTVDNVGAVMEICRRVDRIPLAIELAAARLAIMSPAELLDRLQIGMLTGGSADRDERQRTLHAAIDWSYRLLDDAGRTLFRRLSVFAGGATLADVEAVLDEEGRVDALDGLTSLVQQSMVWRDQSAGETSRFRMLETIREFASSELQRCGELPAMSQRHAEHFLSFMETTNEHIDGPDAEEWMHRVEHEMPNLRAVLRWTLEVDEGSAETGVALVNSLGWFWYVRGDANEALRWLRLAIRASNDTPPALRVRLVYYAAAMEERLGLLDEAAATFEEALAMFRELGDRPRVAMTLNSLGGLAVDSGDITGALDRLNEAEQILCTEEDGYGRAVNMVNLCDAAVAAGDLDRAEHLGQSAVALFADMENHWGVASAMRHLAKVAYARHDLPETRARLLDALDRSRRMGDRPGAARCLERLAGVEIALDSPLRGTRLAAAATKLRRDIGDPPSEQRRGEFETSWLAARDLLGDAEFEEVWTQGASMTFDQAVDYGMAVVDAESE